MPDRRKGKLSILKSPGALKIAGTYLLIGALWILFSDSFVGWIATNPTMHTTLSVLKGWVYVLLTAILLYWLIRSETKSIQERENQLRLVTDAMPAMIAYIDVERSYRMVNRAYRDWFGLTNILVEGQCMEEVLDPAVYREISGFVDTALTGKTVEVDHSLTGLDGKIGIFHSSYIPNIASDGLVQGVFQLSNDITERKRAEKEAISRDVEIELQRRLLDQREQERIQIARDLHDGPVQEILGAIYTLQNLRFDLKDRPLLADRAAEAQRILDQQVAELRSYAGELRPPSLPRFGLEKAIQSHLETWQRKHPEIRADFKCDQAEQTLPEPLQLPLFRVYQESVNNILKHAQADQVHIHLEKKVENQVRLTIQDNGVGFDPPSDLLSLARQGHLGIVGIRERVEAIGGCVEFHSQPGQGTQLEVTVPL